MTDQHNTLRGEAEKALIKAADSLLTQEGIWNYADQVKIARERVIKYMTAFAISPAVSNFHKQTAETKSGKSAEEILMPKIEECTFDVEENFGFYKREVLEAMEEYAQSLIAEKDREIEYLKALNEGARETESHWLDQIITLKSDLLTSQTRNDELTASLEKALNEIDELKKEHNKTFGHLKASHNREKVLKSDLEKAMKEVDELRRLYEVKWNRGELQSPKPKNLEELREKFTGEEFINAGRKEWNAEGPQEYCYFEFGVKYLFEQIKSHLSTLDTEIGVSDEIIKKIDFIIAMWKDPSKEMNWLHSFEQLRKEIIELSPHTGESEAKKPLTEMSEADSIKIMQSEGNWFGDTKHLIEYLTNSFSDGTIKMRTYDFLKSKGYDAPKEFKNQNK